jgi:hypothetical protein
MEQTKIAAEERGPHRQRQVRARTLWSFFDYEDWVCIISHLYDNYDNVHDGSGKVLKMHLYKGKSYKCC